MPFSLAQYHELHRAQQHHRVGAEVRYREVTASTMDDARDGALGGAPCGTAYVAGHQTAGRGRQQRRWEGAQASGLYVTFHLCPPPQRREWSAVVGALAAADAIEALCGLHPDLKWPNDLLIDGQKLAGILAESSGDAVYLGIGINLRPVPEMPPEVAALATNVEAAGAPAPAREALLAMLAARLDVWGESPVAEVRAAWRERLVTLGRTVRLAPPGAEDQAVEGLAVDIGDDGELVLELAGGERRAFRAGEVTTLR